MIIYYDECEVVFNSEVSAELRRAQLNHSVYMCEYISEAFVSAFETTLRSKQSNCRSHN